MSLGWLALARGSLDRMAERRRDEEFVQAAWAQAKIVIVDEQGRAAVRVEQRPELVFVAPEKAPDAERIFLGLDEDKTPYFAVAAALPELDGAQPGGLRGVGALLSDLDSAVMTHAVALTIWHANHRFCPRCGAETKVVAAGHVRVCPADGAEQYPRLDPAVIMLVADDEDRVLLARSPAWPERMFSVLAGFVEPGESLEQAVARETLEEVGLHVEEIIYMGSQPWPLPQSLMLGYICRASGDQALTLEEGEIADARWFTREELQSATLSGEILVPGKVSIARRLIEHWYGGELSGSWGL